MNNRIFIGFLFGVSMSSFAQDSWVQRDSINGSPKSSGAVFALNDDAYFLTGLDEFGFKRSMYSYDVSQDDWDDELSLGGDAGRWFESRISNRIFSWRLWFLWIRNW
jgi:hypothetical protein